MGYLTLNMLYIYLNDLRKGSNMARMIFDEKVAYTVMFGKDYGSSNPGLDNCSIILDGDIIFTSGQNLSTSTISITAPASGTTPFGVGRLPAVGDVEDAVAATLPTDTITKDGISVTNDSAFLFDDGFGNLVGNGSGTIDYDSGAITLQNCPPNAEMVFSVIGLSGVGCGTSAANVLDQINARSLNAKRNANIRLIGFN